jgi:glycerate kinase
MGRPRELAGATGRPRVPGGCQTQPVRVLVAPDCFAGTLTARQAAQAMAAGWKRHAPDDDVTLCPLSDGGPGFLEVLRDALGGRLLAQTVAGPLGGPVTAAVLLVEASDGVPTAYVESAQACGLHLVPAHRWDPGVTTTLGVGQLLHAARATGARRIVLGLGGSGTNDAGSGMLAGLAAAETLDEHIDEVGAPRAHHERFCRGGAGLAGVEPGEVTWIAAVRNAWQDIELIAASDVDSPLLGFHGASAAFAPQKGATPERAQELERCLGDFAAAVESAGVSERKAAGLPGAGAGGGLGFGLRLLGAQGVPAAQAVLDAVDLPGRLAASDLVVTGEGCFDWQSLRSKVVSAVARAAMECGTPVVVLAGQVLVGRREAQTIGVESAYAVARTPQEIERSLAAPFDALAARAERIARTWSPR